MPFPPNCASKKLMRIVWCISPNQTTWTTTATICPLAHKHFNTKGKTETQTVQHGVDDRQIKLSLIIWNVFQKHGGSLHLTEEKCLNLIFLLPLLLDSFLNKRTYTEAQTVCENVNCRWIFGMCLEWVVPGGKGGIH